MSAREEFTELLTFFVKLDRANRYDWGHDSDVRVARLVETFGRAIDEAVGAAIEAHCEDRPHIHADGSTS